MSRWNWILACGAVAMSACAGGAPESALDVPGQIVQEVEEGGDNPPSQPLKVGNRGTCPLKLTATAYTVDGGPWLGVTPAGEITVAPDAQTTLTVAFFIAGLVPGIYVGNISLDGICTITGQGARGNKTSVQVNLRVTAVGASITVDNSSIFVDVGAVKDEWTTMADHTTASAARQWHTAIWTGRQMWIFGGSDGTDQLGTGGKYEPLTDSWSAMPTASGPGHRKDHTAVWTGTEMIVWGGYDTPGGVLTYLNTGGRLGTQWTDVTTVGAPSARPGHTAVWAGGAWMIVFGGYTSGDVTNTGGRYNVGSGWQPLPPEGAPAARTRHSAVWTGRHMLVWGGEDKDGNPVSGGKKYDLAANDWSPMASGGPERSWMLSAWTGSRWLLLGGRAGQGGASYFDGMMYSPSTDSWEEIPPTDVNMLANSATAVWTGRELIVWSANQGRRFNPQNRTWSNVAANTGFTRSGHSAVWTGNTMFLYGGVNQGTFFASGAIYR